jgi:hypothetical protein
MITLVKCRGQEWAIQVGRFIFLRLEASQAEYFVVLGEYDTRGVDQTMALGAGHENPFIVPVCDALHDIFRRWFLGLLVSEHMKRIFRDLVTQDFKPTGQVLGHTSLPHVFHDGRIVEIRTTATQYHLEPRFAWT